MTTALYATFTVRMGAESRVRDLVAGLTERVRSEPGNLAFDPSTFVDDDRKYFVYEIYRDADAFSAHIRAEYVLAFNVELASLIEEPASQLTWLTPL